MMDGSLSYATGGRGIFKHTDGPFAGPTSRNATEVLGSGVVDSGAFGEIAFSPAEQEAASRATAESIAKLGAGLKDLAPGEKATIEELIASAAEWSRQASLPWYKRPQVWTWIVGGVLVTGGTILIYRHVRRSRTEGEAR